MVEEQLRDAQLTVDPAERLAKLRVLRGWATDLLGDIDRGILDLEKVREAETFAGDQAALRLAGRAAIRDELARKASLDEDDETFTADDLRALKEEGLYDAVVEEVIWREALHQRNRRGQFREMAKYFQMDQPDTRIIPMSKTKRLHDDSEEKVARGRKHMDDAFAGKRDKRVPLSVRREADGSYTVLDGKATHTNLERMGFTHVPVRVVEDVPEEPLAAAAADRVARQAEKDDERVTPILRESVMAIGGRLEGLQFRLKTRESLERKINTYREKYNLKGGEGKGYDEAADRIPDALRYTAVFEAGDYTEGIQRALARLSQAGFQQYELENYWGGRDEYEGIHAGLIGPEGGKIELQFHTPESYDAKERKNHSLYEEYRTSDDRVRRFNLYQEMVGNMMIDQPTGVEAVAPTIRRAAPEVPEHEQGWSLGATPFREGKDVATGFYASERARQFEAYVSRAAELHGIQLREVTRAQGVWQGTTEPSYDLRVKDGKEAVSAFAEDVRSRFEQQAVIGFKLDPDADSSRLRLVGAKANHRALLQALDEVGLQGGRILEDGTFETFGTEEDGRRVAQLRDRFGGRFLAMPGQLSLVEET